MTKYFYCSLLKTLYRVRRQDEKLVQCELLSDNMSWIRAVRNPYTETDLFGKYFKLITKRESKRRFPKATI